MFTNGVIIVGAGFYGGVLAERIASVYKLPVTVIDRRSHPGGNCWSEMDEKTGIEYHKYGPHIFHTDDENVWNYVSRFTKWNNYEHHAWTRHKGFLYSLPINLQTINSFFQKNFSPSQAREFIEQLNSQENMDEPANLEEKAISLIGRPLYEAFIKGYTKKQWEKDPRELPASIITRLPVRYNYNSRYFNDRYEGLPLDGYASLFKNLYSNKLINLKLATDWKDIKELVPDSVPVIYTGGIDQFFDYKLGGLDWRTLDFEVERLDTPDYQGTAIVNEADEDIPYTRTAEYKHLHPEREDTGQTIIIREKSRLANFKADPYYPVSTRKNLDLLEAYQKEAEKLGNVMFGGRLGNYKYYDMDDTVLSALRLFDTEKFAKFAHGQFA